jgi:hypothetical protein
MLGRALEVLHARNETEIERAFAVLVQKSVGALVVVSDGFFNSRPKQFAVLAAHHMIPAVYSFHEFAKLGGLMSYGTMLFAALHMSAAGTEQRSVEVNLTPGIGCGADLEHFPAALNQGDSQLPLPRRIWRN